MALSGILDEMEPDHSDHDTDRKNMSAAVIHGGFPKWGGVPPNGWFIRENPN